jgi:CRP/FNR family transcriptional regulator, cyclic AMP receptor protein
MLAHSFKPAKIETMHTHQEYRQSSTRIGQSAHLKKKKTKSETMKVDELITSPRPFLKGMRRQHVRYLNEIALRTNFAEGEWIFREGERADRFYLIVEGSVIITSRMPIHSHIGIQTLGAGNAIGWSALFKPYTWHLDARADEPTRVLSFRAARLREQCKRHPELGYELMERVGYMLMERFQAARLKLLNAYAVATIEM